MTERSAYPDEREVRAAEREYHDLETSTAFVGRVHRYSRETGTVDVVPMVRQQIPRPDGSYGFEEDLPIIPEVPLCWPRMGPWFVSMSIELGDCVLCVVLDGDHSPWRVSRATEGMTGLDRALRGVTNPSDLRRHHLAHAVALPMGPEHRWNTLRHAPDPDQGAARFVIGSDLDGGSRFAFHSDGSVVVTQGEVVVSRITPDGVSHLGGPDGVAPATAAQVTERLNALKTAMVGAVDTAAIVSVFAAWVTSMDGASKVRVT